MWNVEAKVIAVIRWATGNVSKSLQTVPEQQSGET